MAIFIYELLNNLDSDNLINITANNNVIVNKMSDISVRDSSNTTTNMTTNETNTTTELPNVTSKTTAILVGCAVAFSIIVLGGIGFSMVSQLNFNA